MSWVATLIPDKIDFKFKKVKKHKGKHYILIKVSVQQEHIIFTHLIKDL